MGNSKDKEEKNTGNSKDKEEKNMGNSKDKEEKNMGNSKDKEEDQTGLNAVSRSVSAIGIGNQAWEEDLINITELPDVVIDLLTDDYLPFSDLLNFCHTCTKFLAYKPKYQVIKKQGFEERGKSGGHWDIKPWFDIPLESRGLSSVEMKFKWKDQGWGNRKGELWVDLVRQGDVIVNSYNLHKAGVAPHQWADESIKYGLEQDVVNKAERGDVVRVMYNTGAGGGHVLYVKDFYIRLVHKKEAEINE